MLDIEAIFDAVLVLDDTADIEQSRSLSICFQAICAVRARHLQEILCQIFENDRANLCKTTIPKVRFAYRRWTSAAAPEAGGRSHSTVLNRS